MKSNKKQCKNIGLFGSSFNPPHLGHFAVISDLIKRNIFEEIWLLPVYAHAFGKDMVDFDHRLAMTELLKNEIKSDRLKISTIEKQLGKSPSYSYDVVTALRQSHLDKNFTLILGTDTRHDLPRWHRIEDLKKICDFYFVPRAGLEESPYPDVSSSEIRKKIKAREPLGELTLPSVIAYIKKFNIYF